MKQVYPEELLSELITGWSIRRKDKENKSTNQPGDW